MARRSHVISEPKREQNRLDAAARRARSSGVDDDTDDVAKLRGAFVDIIFGDKHEARSFFTTAGIGWMVSKTGMSADQVWPAFRDHYTTDGEIDGARFAADLAIWPPIASRVEQLRQGRA